MKIMALGFIFLSIAVAAVYLFMQHPKFGKAPSGERLERIRKSPHYKNGRFDNLNPTPQLAEDTSMPEVMFRFLFGKYPNKIPQQAFKFEKTDLKRLNPSENVYVWMGHSSYFLQIDDKRLLVDPVLSGNASPVSFTTKAFTGADLYSAEDIPDLDYLIITHDHWDHLDYETVKALRHKVGRVITGLGTGAHLEHWDFAPEMITELDWGEAADLGNGFLVHCEAARHFSGRGFKRDQAIWASFIFETPKRKVYIGGDSGFDSHFEQIGLKHKNLDLAILENGQYNKDWRYIHMLPEEFMKAAEQLNAKRIIPVHNSKFSLATHSWKEPLEAITELNKEKNLRIITPKIGEKVNWENDTKIYEQWWKSYQ